MVTELLECGGTDPCCVLDAFQFEDPIFVAKHGKEAIEQMTKRVLASEIPVISGLFQSLFHSFNLKYFSGALERYEVLVVFDICTFANDTEPDCLSVTDGLIRFEERRIYIRYSTGQRMRATLIHEMAHAATSGEHDERWLNEIVRLHDAGAPVPGSGSQMGVGQP